MTYREEINRTVLAYLLDQHPGSASFNDKQWQDAYKHIRLLEQISTINFKAENAMPCFTEYLQSGKTVYFHA